MTRNLSQRVSRCRGTMPCAVASARAVGGRARGGRRRRALVLPLMLLILVLLGLLAASFAFDIQADVASTHAVAHRMRTRLAAEAGLQRVMLLLRTQRLDVDAWYHNEEELHRAVVWQAVKPLCIFRTKDIRLPSLKCKADWLLKQPECLLPPRYAR